MKRSLEQRKVHCKAMQGDEGTQCPQKLEPPKGFQQSIFKKPDEGGGPQGM